MRHFVVKSQLRAAFPKAVVQFVESGPHQEPSARLENDKKNIVNHPINTVFTYQ